MRTLFTATVVGLLYGSSFAQSPGPQELPPHGASAPLRDSAPGGPGARDRDVTMSARVRAFAAGPHGEVRSVYLANGNVVELPGDFGPDFAARLHKGVRLHVVGSRTVVQGQAIVTPAQITVGERSFTANPGVGRDLRAGLLTPGDGPVGPPPPPVGGRMSPPAGRSGGPPPPRPAGAPATAPPPLFPSTAGDARLPPPPPACAGGPGVSPEQPPIAPAAAPMAARPSGSDGPAPLPKNNAAHGAPAPPSTNGDAPPPVAPQQ